MSYALRYLPDDWSSFGGVVVLLYLIFLSCVSAGGVIGAVKVSSNHEWAALRY
jgi:hypothetical protein